MIRRLIKLLLIVGCEDRGSNGDKSISDFCIIFCDEEALVLLEPISCDGLTEVELWGEWYDIATMSINLINQELTGSIPPEIGCLTNLGYLWLYNNQLTGEIPPEVCDLIESNNLDMNYILYGNENLINTCD